MGDDFSTIKFYFAQNWCVIMSVFYYFKINSDHLNGKRPVLQENRHRSTRDGHSGNARISVDVKRVTSSVRFCRADLRTPVNATSGDDYNNHVARELRWDVHSQPARHHSVIAAFRSCWRASLYHTCLQLEARYRRCSIIPARVCWVGRSTTSDSGWKRSIFSTI